MKGGEIGGYEDGIRRVGCTCWHCMCNSPLCCVCFATCHRPFGGEHSSLSGAAFHNHLGVIVVEVLAAVAAPQFAYVAVRLIYFHARSIGLTRPTQTTIG